MIPFRGPLLVRKMSCPWSWIFQWRSICSHTCEGLAKGTWGQDVIATAANRMHHQVWNHSLFWHWISETVGLRLRCLSIALGDGWFYDLNFFHARPGIFTGWYRCQVWIITTADSCQVLGFQSMQNPSNGYICTKPESAQSGMESNSEGADGDQHPSTDRYVPSLAHGWLSAVDYMLLWIARGTERKSSVSADIDVLELWIQFLENYRCFILIPWVTFCGICFLGYEGSLIVGFYWFASSLRH